MSKQHRRSMWNIIILDKLVSATVLYSTQNQQPQIIIQTRNLIAALKQGTHTMIQHQKSWRNHTRHEWQIMVDGRMLWGMSEEGDRINTCCKTWQGTTNQSGTIMPSLDQSDNSECQCRSSQPSWNSEHLHRRSPASLPLLPTFCTQYGKVNHTSSKH